MLSDLRYVIRGLWKAPGFVAIVALSLGLGIGANTAVYTTVNALFLRKPRVDKPAEIVRLHCGKRGRTPRERFSYDDYAHIRKSNDVFAGVVAHRPAGPLSLVDKQSRLSVHVAFVSGNYFSVLGIKPVLGRTFDLPHAGPASAQPVVVLSERLWRRQFETDPGVVGREVRLNGIALSVLGVAREPFPGTDDARGAQVWAPLAMASLAMHEEQDRSDQPLLWAFARRKRGVSTEQAQSAMDVVARQVSSTSPDRAELVFAVRDSLGPPGTERVYAMISAVPMSVALLVLLIACFNASNLMLARNATRRKELAVRLAMGAGNGRIVRLVAIESLVLAALGAVVGLVFAASVGGTLFPLPTDPAMPFELERDLDGNILAFSLLVSLLATAVASQAPVRALRRSALLPSLQGRRLDGRARTSGARFSIVAQIAMCVPALVLAGLFARSLAHALDAGRGIELRDALVVSPPSLRDHGYDEVRIRAFYDELLTRAAALPGVRGATLAQEIPASFMTNREPVTVRLPGSEQTYETEASVVGPSYFRTMGIPIVVGAAFDDTPHTAEPESVIVNETMARRLWAESSPVGTAVVVDGKMLRIVGVARDIDRQSIGRRPSYMYRPYSSGVPDSMLLVVSSTGDPKELAGPVRHLGATLDADMALADVRPLSEHVGVKPFLARMALRTLGSLGALALCLAGLGLYGATAYATRRRWREFAIRAAVGAQNRNVVWSAMWPNLVMAAVGLVLGLAGAAALTGFIRAVLYVSPTDPATFVAVPVFIVCVLAAASYLAARPVTRLDPAETLRNE
jgi:predicted permease